MTALVQLYVRADPIEQAILVRLVDARCRGIQVDGVLIVERGEHPLDRPLHEALTLNRLPVVLLLDEVPCLPEGIELMAEVVRRLLHRLGALSRVAGWPYELPRGGGRYAAALERHAGREGARRDHPGERERKRDPRCGAAPPRIHV